MSKHKRCKKVRYPTQHLARVALRECQVKYEDWALREYHCDRCGAWHIGHPR